MKKTIKKGEREIMDAKEKSAVHIINKALVFRICKSPRHW